MLPRNFPKSFEILKYHALRTATNLAGRSVRTKRRSRFYDVYELSNLTIEIKYLHRS